MSRHARQKGQALVASLVTMALLFSIAGGLAVAVSAALTAEGPSTATYLRDTAAVSATAAVAAGVAGRDGRCPSGTIFGDIAPASYSCNEIDLIAPNNLTLAPLTWSGGCAVQAVSAIGHVTAWLNARGQTPSSFYIDGSASGCSPGPGACVANSKAGGAASFLLISDCAMPASGKAYVHVSGPAGSARLARVAVLTSLVPGQTIGAQVAGPIATSALRGPGRPLDLIVGTSDINGGHVLVYLGNGDGTFATSPSYSYRVGYDVTALTVADLVGRGWPGDVAATSFGSNRVSVLVGMGDGSFKAPNTIGLGKQLLGLGTIAAGPLLRGSGNPPDLIVGNLLDQSVAVLPAVGNGKFDTPVICPVGGAPAALATLDLGRTYLAVATNDELTVYEPGGGSSCPSSGNKGGNPIIRKVGSSYQLDDAAGAMAVGRFSGGQLADLAVSVPNRQEVQIVFGQQTGRLSSGKRVPLDGTPVAVFAGNFGSGSSADLAVTTISSPVGDDVSVYLRSTGFLPILGGGIPTGKAPAGVTAGDFQGLGTDDLAVASIGDQNVQVFLRNHSKLFSIVGAAPDGSAFNEADVVWSQTTHSNSLRFEGGIG